MRNHAWFDIVYLGKGKRSAFYWMEFLWRRGKEYLKSFSFAIDFDAEVFQFCHGLRRWTANACCPAAWETLQLVLCRFWFWERLNLYNLFIWKSVEFLTSHVIEVWTAGWGVVQGRKHRPRCSILFWATDYQNGRLTIHHQVTDCLCGVLLAWTFLMDHKARFALDERECTFPYDRQPSSTAIPNKWFGFCL